MPSSASDSLVIFIPKSNPEMPPRIKMRRKAVLLSIFTDLGTERSEIRALKSLRCLCSSFADDSDTPEPSSSPSCSSWSFGNYWTNEKLIFLDFGLVGKKVIVFFYFLWFCIFFHLLSLSFAGSLEGSQVVIVVVIIISVWIGILIMVVVIS